MTITAGTAHEGVPCVPVGATRRRVLCRSAGQCRRLRASHDDEPGGWIDHRANEEDCSGGDSGAPHYRVPIHMSFLIPLNCGLRPVFDLRQQRGLDPDASVSDLLAASATPNENRRRFNRS
jgi:hypothetical protein